MRTGKSNKLFSLYKTIIETVSNSTDEVQPVILVWDAKSKKIALHAINNLRGIFPEVENISVNIIN